MRGLDEIVKDNNNAHRQAVAPRTLANATSGALLGEQVVARRKRQDKERSAGSVETV